MELAYLSECQCGHDVPSHGADVSVLGRPEYQRRGRVAVRIDELLQDAGRLVDFNFLDEDIMSLRLQMSLPRTSSPDDIFTASPSTEKRSLSVDSISLSDNDQEPSKKRQKMMDFSLGDMQEDGYDDDDDDCDEPLAAQIGPSRQPLSGHRAKKGHKTQAGTSPASMPPPTGLALAEMNRQITHGEPRIKVEEKMDEGQLNRLATGVTVDTDTAAATPSGMKPEKASWVELRRGVINVVPVENDGEPRSMIILTGLKTLFQKQLPKMPREYIARLVYDSNSRCLAIIKHGYLVVGGICFRPFPHRKFAEIVFFATNSADQVKGYGGMLMDHFKHHVRTTYPSMMHFLTYADNYAVGYFKKQGFTKEITLPRSVWAGYIKDYEGGTIMECALLPKVNYLEIRDMVSRQREAVMTKIREISKSHIVYSGIQRFQITNDGEFRIDYRDVPGLAESGWTPDQTDITRSPHKSPERNIMERLLSDLQQHPLSWAFLQPVNAEEVPDYYEVIKDPMDFSTMEHKLETNQYPNLDAFVDDAQLVFDNCRIYNPDGSIYARNATKMEKFMKEQLASYHVKQEEC
ncbi:Bromodomain-containing protein [Thelephora ganbajun]|uniref:Bromodomain-containing protein n=1 Tax=Thelephora ganbajun TaxID=370292 RepID=A0ACB6ZX68_THEGA|nr:Bromodomain-containing protein [Thelephora ganbajun]